MIRPPRHAGELNFGYSRSAWWLRLELPAAGDTPRRRWLEIAFPTLDRIDFFPPAGPALRARDQWPFAARSLRHRNFIFAVELAAERAQTGYLRIASSGTLTVPVVLWTPTALHAPDQTVYAAHALYFGALIALGLFNLMLWVSLRERSYLA